MGTAARHDSADRTCKQPAGRLPFLRVPPFPAARGANFASPGGQEPSIDEIGPIADRIRTLRVGGSYWAKQPELPDSYVILRVPSAVAAARMRWHDRPLITWDCGEGEQDCDPWHMLARATALVADPDDEVCAIAALLSVPIYCHEDEAGELRPISLAAPEALRAILGNTIYRNPFDGQEMGVVEAIDLCGFWRQLIDSNRDLVAAFGFAGWKQQNVAPLLWGGGAPIAYRRSVPSGLRGKAVAIWRAKVSHEVTAQLEQSGAALVEVEDGFLRSQGLGADCVPPLSITVDRLGAYFDPSRASALEHLLQEGEFDAPLVERARTLRQLIVEAGLGKYGVGVETFDRPAGSRRHILVPGQVEDDRSVQAGGAGLTSNLELLKRVRAKEPDAFILYKPHPDVVAGHRKGHIPDSACRDYADTIVEGADVTSLIAMVDEVHVNTSLAGFEALMRDKAVVTHGVPFYAGWGLTTDYGPVPARRNRKRTIDELVAATLLLYPRYIDPVSGLPCPAEVVVARLVAGAAPNAGPLVALRRLQGRLMRRFRRQVR